jgi:hypothetical protein
VALQSTAERWRWQHQPGVKGQYYHPDSAEPIHLDHTGHPAADRFALARASTSRVQAFGLEWEDASGKHNGQYAPFSWRA